jgi:hypothetical protein
VLLIYILGKEVQRKFKIWKCFRVWRAWYKKALTYVLFINIVSNTQNTSSHHSNYSPMTGSNRVEDNDERKEAEKRSSGSTPETAMCQKQ